MALGTATCASFAVPEGGALIGGSIAAGQFVFDIFYPSDDRVNPADLPASRADIDRATDTIVDAINDAAFAAHRDNVATFASDFQEVWKRLQTRPDGLSPATWLTVSGQLKLQCDRYFNDAKSTDDLKKAIRWIESKNCPNNMVPVYLLAGSLMIAYHKTGLNWEINSIVDRYRAGQSTQDDGPPSTAEMISASFHAATLRDDVLPDLIAKATTIHDGWQSRWDNRRKQLDEAHRKFLADHAAVNPLQQQIQWGGEFAYHFNEQTARLNLTGVNSEDDIRKMGQTIDKWKTIQASLVPEPQS